MAKIYIINECNECPEYNDVTFKCLETDKFVNDINSIPEWCPLPGPPEQEG